MAAIALTNTSQKIFYEFPYGKPNPKEVYVGAPDQRTRVNQAPSKGECSYYAFNYLRDRIGPIYDEQYSGYRETEKTISQWRKQRIAAKFFENLGVFSEEQYKNKRTEIDTSVFQSFGLDLMFLMMGVISWRTKVSLVDVWNDLGGSQKPRAGIQREVLMMFSHVFGQYQHQILDCLAISVIIEKYGLKLSTWTPQQPFEQFLKILKDHGPMAICALIGKDYYKKAPLISARKIEGRDIFYFPKGAEKVSHSDGHIIIVVGAEKIEEKEIVYFIDPNDGSDVKKGQPVYAISYSNLKDSIAQPIMLPITTEDKSTRKLVQTKEAYGVHSPKVRDVHNTSTETQLVEEISKLALSK